jgi:hypothetical protein
VPRSTTQRIDDNEGEREEGNPAGPAGVQEDGYEFKTLPGVGGTNNNPDLLDLSIMRRRVLMLWSVFVILLLTWILGVVTSTTIGGFIHVLLVLALIVALIRIFMGRSPV